MQHKSRERLERRIGVALDDPRPRQCLARPGNPSRPQQNESRSALPTGKSGLELTGDWHPDLPAGLDLQDIDAEATVVDLEVAPSHFDEIGTALAGIGAQRHHLGELGTRTSLGKPNLLISPRA